MPIKIKKIFEREYTGKPVPKKYQSKYGKKYDKNEIKSVSYAIARSKGVKIEK